MQKNIRAEISPLTYELRKFASGRLPAIEKEVNALIARKETDLQIIECLLEIISVLMEMGVGKTVYERLYKYHEHVKSA